MKYKITVAFEGYCRGEEYYEVLADSEEEARAMIWRSEPIDSEVVRDDMEREVLEVSV